MLVPSGYLSWSAAVDRVLAQRAPELVAAVRQNDSQWRHLYRERGRRFAGRPALADPERLAELEDERDQLSEQRQAVVRELLQAIVDGVLNGWLVSDGGELVLQASAAWRTDTAQRRLATAANPGWDDQASPLLRGDHVEQWAADPVRWTAGVIERAEKAGTPAQPEKPLSSTALVPYDSERAHALLAGEKLRGIFKYAPPTEDQSRDYLKTVFFTVNKDSHRAIRQTLWPDLKPGRRRNPRTQF